MKTLLSIVFAFITCLAMPLQAQDGMPVCPTDWIVAGGIICFIPVGVNPANGTTIVLPVRIFLYTEAQSNPVWNSNILSSPLYSVITPPLDIHVSPGYPYNYNGSHNTYSTDHPIVIETSSDMAMWSPAYQLSFVTGNSGMCGGIATNVWGLVEGTFSIPSDIFGELIPLKVRAVFNPLDCRYPGGSSSEQLKGSVVILNFLAPPQTTLSCSWDKNYYDFLYDPGYSQYFRLNCNENIVECP